MSPDEVVKERRSSHSQGALYCSARNARGCEGRACLGPLRCICFSAPSSSLDCGVVLAECMAISA
eukprot:1365064-Pleurochrysis_carterae.AAC.1